MKANIGYFPHDFNSRNDERILELREKHGPAGYAWFFMLCEIMAENEDGCLDLDRTCGYSISMAITKDKLQEFLKDCRELKLLVSGPTPSKLTSLRMQAHKSSRQAMSRGAKKAKTTQPRSTPEPQQPQFVPQSSTKKPLLEFPKQPREEIEKAKPIELEAFKLQFNAEIRKTGATWEEILDKWNTSLQSTNDDYPIEDSQRHKQLIATLRRYILSWIRNAQRPGSNNQQPRERILEG